MIYIGVFLLLISCLYLFFVALNNPFINLKNIIKNYYLIFNNIKYSTPFTVLPFTFGLGIAFIFQIDENMLIQIIVFLSIIISILFAVSSIIATKDIKESKDVNIIITQKVEKQSQSIILYEVVLCIFLLIIILITIAIYNFLFICYVGELVINFIIYYLLIKIILNLFIVIKRLSKLTEI